MDSFTIFKIKQIKNEKIYIQKIELIFEKFTSVATSILGNSITFIAALGMVTFWLSHKMFTNPNIGDIIRDIIHGTTFLSLFIIQKSFNRFSAILHLKVNELVSSNDLASNTVMNLEIKTEQELAALNKEYEELVHKENQMP
jgi:low affinity Fe/Cu permease